MNLRPEVQAFAEMMEARLRVNDHKGGWHKDSQAVLLARLYANLPELPSLEACVDVANYALMLVVPCGLTAAPAPDAVAVARRLGLSQQAAERMAGVEENITAGVPPTRTPRVKAGACPQCNGSGALKEAPTGVRWPLCDKCAGTGRAAHGVTGRRPLTKAAIDAIVYRCRQEADGNETTYAIVAAVEAAHGIAGVKTCDGGQQG